MNKYYLVKFSLDWSDEFDVTGVSVCDTIRLEHERSIAREQADYIFKEIGFGTNESFYDIQMCELFEAYTFTEISESTYNELKHQFISMYSEGFGTWFTWPSSLINTYKKEEMEE